MVAWNKVGQQNSCALPCFHQQPSAPKWPQDTNVRCLSIHFLLINVHITQCFIASTINNKLSTTPKLCRCNAQAKTASFADIEVGMVDSVQECPQRRLFSSLQDEKGYENHLAGYSCTLMYTHTHTYDRWASNSSHSGQRTARKCYALRNGNVLAFYPKHGSFSQYVPPPGAL
jgi:hypothetical protein